ncbi:MAG: cAMP/cGMP-dependent 3',5'-cyclic-AMP/GMP phosphodiesterase [bacterium]|nr:cAMP/cGMP-dependent 3',5'-cyclic-AMP/GMP phosphodiesterase [bacterium]
MKPLHELDGVVTLLPRGGYLVDSPIGYIQVGSPPETIKDTMLLPKGVPQIFVLPNKLFNWHRGISVADIEFPIYFNFFIKKRKTYIICTKSQYKRIKKVLQESVFGPKDLDIAIDYEIRSENSHFSEIKHEMNFFRNNLKLSDLFAAGLFNEENSFTFKGITITFDGDEYFKISKGDKKIAQIPALIEYKAAYNIGERLHDPYIPPLFSITCLGPSHGFDPEDNTSGYIIWLNHRGIMVDPPVDSTEWLKDSNVNSKLIDSIILTHCHADHDAGTFQKILEEERVTVYSTKTIIMSFLRKYSSLANVPISYLMKLFDFHPVKINEPVYIHNGKFDMFYTLHSIPTIGFNMEFQNQSFAYSSDHNNDPEIHKELYDKGIISAERYEELSSFPWESKVIYHESGIPPLHTPLTYLNSLTKEIQEKTVIYHISKKDFIEGTSLKLATFGIENTLNFDTQSPPFEQAQEILGLLKHLDFFNDISVEKAREFLDIVEEKKYSKGDLIIKKGTRGDKFYIINSGNVSVHSGGLAQNKIYGTYEYFGEVALVTEGTRAADVFAETDVILYTIVRDKFLNFIVGTEFEATLKRLAKIRTSETWNLLSTSKYFQHCTSSQKTWLESIFIPIKRKGPGYLIEEGNKLEFVYILRDGEVEVHKSGATLATLRKGDFIGAMHKVYNKEPADYTFYHKDPVSLYAMKSEDIHNFVENNPGLLMKLAYDF